MNLTKQIQNHVEKQNLRFKPLDPHTRNIIKELSIPNIELQHLYMNHPVDTSFEPAEGIWEDGVALAKKVGEYVAPIVPEVLLDDELKKNKVDMEEIVAQEKTEIAKVPLHLYMTENQLATMSEEKKQDMREFFYENHWRNKMASKIGKNLRKTGEFWAKDPQVRFATELGIFKQKLEEFVRLKHGEIQKLFDEDAISGEIQRALLKTITVQNIVADSIASEEKKAFISSEAKKPFDVAEPMKGKLVFKEDSRPFKVIKNPTEAQLKVQFERIKLTAVKLLGLSLNEASSLATSLIRRTGNVGSLVSTFAKYGFGGGVSAAAATAICGGIEAQINALYYTVFGTATGTAVSVSILYSVYKICQIEPPKLGGAIDFLDETLNLTSEWMGTLTDLNLGGEDVATKMPNKTAMMDAIGEEATDSAEAAETLIDPETPGGIQDQDLLGAQAWVSSYIQQEEEIGFLTTETSPDYTFKIRVADKLVDFGTARARRDEIFTKIGKIAGMTSHQFTSVNDEVKPYYVYKPFETNQRCIFTRLTMGKLVSFLDSLNEVQKNYVCKQFHLVIPLNYQMGQTLSDLIGTENNKFMNGNNEICYPANCVFNIIEQAESVEMLKGHKENRDFETLLKTKEGSFIFRLFSKLIHYLQDQYQKIPIVGSAVKKICYVIWQGLKSLTGWVGEMIKGLIKCFPLSSDTDKFITGIVDFLVRSSGAVMESLSLNLYQHVMDLVDYVVEKQVYLLLINTVICVGVQTVILTGAGFLFPAVAGHAVGVGSSYVMWKGVKLATQMMGMQIADAIITIMGSSGRTFTRWLATKTYIGQFLSYALPGKMGEWIVKLLNVSMGFKKSMAPNSTDTLNGSFARSLTGAGMVMVGGVAYFFTLPFSLPFSIVAGATGALIMGREYFGQTISAYEHGVEAFRVSTGFFHQMATNMLYALITSPVDGLSSLFKSGANITYMQLLQPIRYIDLLCRIFNSGFLGRICEKFKKIFIKVWKRAFATRFIYGVIMDVVILSQWAPTSWGWSSGNCSGHLSRVPINDFKRVKFYTMVSDGNKVIKFVVDEENPDVRENGKYPKIIQVIINGREYDTESVLVEDTSWGGPGKDTSWGGTGKENWVLKSRQRLEYDTDGKMVITGGTVLDDDYFDGASVIKCKGSLEKFYNRPNIGAIHESSSSIKVEEDVIIWSDVAIPWEIAKVSRTEHENFIVKDKFGVTVAICEDGELRTAPISALSELLRNNPNKYGQKRDVHKSISWKLDKEQFKLGKLKIVSEKNPLTPNKTFVSGYEVTTITGNHSGRTQEQVTTYSEKKGKRYTSAVSALDQSVQNMLENGLELNEPHEITYIPAGSKLLEGRKLEYVKKNFQQMGTLRNSIDYNNSDQVELDFYKNNLAENMQTLLDKVQEEQRSLQEEQRNRAGNAYGFAEEFLEDRSTRGGTRTNKTETKQSTVEEYDTIERNGPMPAPKSEESALSSFMVYMGILPVRRPEGVLVCGPNGRGGKDQCTVKVLKGDTYVSPPLGPSPEEKSLKSLPQPKIKTALETKHIKLIF
tara:strand:+ start:858 stop:5480 length:4623 start_codon:yes stop_codon:yes gene_type:complete